MKPYKRAMEKKNSLISVKYNTINDSDEDEDNCAQSYKFKRKSSSKRGIVPNNNGDDEEGRNQPSRSGKAYWSPEVQHQQDFAEKDACINGVSNRDCGIIGSSSGIKVSKIEKLGEAA